MSIDHMTDQEYIDQLSAEVEQLKAERDAARRELERVRSGKFRVIDLMTGSEADAETIALQEDWAKGLVYCDMEGFAIEEDGTLMLLDECGNYAYCPENRFKIEWTALKGEPDA